MYNIPEGVFVRGAQITEAGPRLLLPYEPKEDRIFKEGLRALPPTVVRDILRTRYSNFAGKHVSFASCQEGKDAACMSF